MIWFPSPLSLPFNTQFRPFSRVKLHACHFVVALCAHSHTHTCTHTRTHIHAYAHTHTFFPQPSALKMLCVSAASTVVATLLSSVQNVGSKVAHCVHRPPAQQRAAAVLRHAICAVGSRGSDYGGGNLGPIEPKVASNCFVSEKVRGCDLGGLISTQMV